MVLAMGVQDGIVVVFVVFVNASVAITVGSTIIRTRMLRLVRVLVLVLVLVASGRGRRAVRGRRIRNVARLGRKSGRRGHNFFLFPFYAHQINKTPLLFFCYPSGTLPAARICFTPGARVLGRAFYSW